MVKEFKIRVRLINLRGKDSADIEKEIRKIIVGQWGDEIVEEDADFDIAIVFGGDLNNPIVSNPRDGVTIKSDDLEDLIERGLKLAFDNKLKARLTNKEQS